MPSWLATIQEKQNSVQNMGLWIFFIISPILFFFYSHFAQLKDTPLRFLVLTHHTCAIHWILGMIPPRSHANASLYMLLILQRKLPLCIINPNALPSSCLDPLEGPSMLNCRKLELEGPHPTSSTKGGKRGVLEVPRFDQEEGLDYQA